MTRSKVRMDEQQLLPGSVIDVDQNISQGTYGFNLIYSNAVC